jgi:release factor glutamine methyltransferase
MYIYEPSDDSYLLADVLKELKCRRFLDMGCGTGLQANSIGNAEEIVCADINKDAVDYSKENVKKIDFVTSDLFEKIEGKFDLIAFNTPYLDEGEPKDTSWTVMQNGKDVIERFIRESRAHLEDGGQIMMLISDRDYQKYEKIAEETGYKWEVAREKQLFFERIFVVKLTIG